MILGLFLPGQRRQRHDEAPLHGPLHFLVLRDIRLDDPDARERPQSHRLETPRTVPADGRGHRYQDHDWHDHAAPPDGHSPSARSMSGSTRGYGGQPRVRQQSVGCRDPNAQAVDPAQVGQLYPCRLPGQCEAKGKPRERQIGEIREQELEADPRRRQQHGQRPTRNAPGDEQRRRGQGDQRRHADDRADIGEECQGREQRQRNRDPVEREPEAHDREPDTEARRH